MRGLWGREAGRLRWPLCVSVDEVVFDKCFMLWKVWGQPKTRAS